MHLCDVFTPCMGYSWDEPDDCTDGAPVSCFQCLASRFADEANAMNLAAIQHLDEEDLLAHFVDRAAMAPGFDDDE